MGRASSVSEATLLLQGGSAGDRGALDRLTPIVYAELRRLARCYLKLEHIGRILVEHACRHNLKALPRGDPGKLR